MRYRYAFSIALLLSLLVATGLANASTQPTPIPSSIPTSPPTAAPSPSPASAATIAWAHKWQKNAQRSYQHWMFARRCWGMGSVAVNLAHPKPSATYGVWREYVADTKVLVGRFDRKYEHLHSAALHPTGGGAARWWPLALWVGWPASEKASFIRCVTDESGGSPAASNGICRGLMQIHECHANKFKQVTGLPYFNGVFNPEANLRFGRFLWGGSGWSPWVVMR